MWGPLRSEWTSGVHDPHGHGASTLSAQDRGRNPNLNYFMDLSTIVRHPSYGIRPMPGFICKNEFPERQHHTPYPSYRKARFLAFPTPASLHLTEIETPAKMKRRKVSRTAYVLLAVRRPRQRRVATNLRGIRKAWVPNLPRWCKEEKQTCKLYRYNKHIRLRMAVCI